MSVFEDTLNVRLGTSGGQANTGGNVEVFVNDEWHAVCFEPKYVGPDEVWDLEAAIVVCRQLGFASGVPVAYHGPTSTGLHVNDVRCEYGNIAGSFNI